MDSTFDLPRLQSSERVVLAALVSRKFVSNRAIADALYSLRDDGGPDDPSRVIAVFLTRLRQKLRPLGIEITVFEKGYNGAPTIYTLTGPVPHAAILAAIVDRYGANPAKVAA
jgi:hypothetical protein